MIALSSTIMPGIKALLALGIALLIASQETATQPIPVGGDVEKPRRTFFVRPDYPPEAEAAAVQSIVILELTVDTEGKVVEVRPLRGADVVVPAAVEAARQWRYEPTVVNGRAVSLRFSETVLFVLRKPTSFGGNGMYLRAPEPGATAASYEDWEVEGEAFTACPCTTPCPCRSNAPPSHPPCHATTVQHFDRGHYGDVDLSGITYVTLGPEDWTAVYFDEHMSDAQRRAVLEIYASMVPGAPQAYRSIRSVPIEYARDGSLKRVVIPSVLEVESTELEGDYVLGMDVWSNRIRYGRTGVYRFSDEALGVRWDHSGRQSNHKRFVTTKADYSEGRMLIQGGDGSGSWTEKQRQLIACLR